MTTDCVTGRVEGAKPGPFLVMALCFLLAGCRSAPPPSILLISVDTLRADRLGAYGYGLPTSPHLDALAARSLVFDSAFVQEPRTLTSHISIMTSQYPDVHGVEDDRPLADGVPVLAQVLRRNGYVTQAFTGGAWAAPDWGLGRGFTDFRHGPGLEPKVEEIRRWLELHHERPFLLFVHGYEVHSTGGGGPFYRAPPPFRHRFSKDLEAPVRDCGDHAPCYQERYEAGLLDEADRRLISASYDEGVAYADKLVGQVLGWVDQLGLEDRLIVLVTSDHGEGLLDHQNWSHVELYDEVVRVPLILRLPGDRHAGRRVPWLVESIDLAPTLLGLLGLPIPSSFQGFDLSQHLADPKGPRRVVHSWRAKGPRPILARMIRTQRWKLILYHDRAELFDLMADPLEQHNLAETRPERVAELRKLMRGPVPGGVAAAADPVLDAETEKQLRTLGYLK